MSLRGSSWVLLLFFRGSRFAHETLTPLVVQPELFILEESRFPRLIGLFQVLLRYSDDWHCAPSSVWVWPKGCLGIQGLKLDPISAPKDVERGTLAAGSRSRDSRSRRGYGAPPLGYRRAPRSRRRRARLRFGRRRPDEGSSRSCRLTCSRRPSGRFGRDRTRVGRR